MKEEIFILRPSLVKEAHVPLNGLKFDDHADRKKFSFS